MKKRGMALMLVLTVASVVVMMTGAFLTANHSNFAMLNATQRQREADLATDSAAHFIYYQLERNQNFASSAFNDNADISPRHGGMRIHRIKNQTAIEGALLDEAGTGREPTFSAQIYNNLGTLNAANQGVPVPADAVLIKITGRSGTAISHCDVLYRGEPLFDASVTANKNVALSTNHSLVVASEDKARNWMRSNGDIYLNGFANGSGRTKLQSQPGSAQGVIWAKNKITSGNPAGASLEGADLANASREAEGILAPKSRLNHDIYKLTSADLKVGGGGSQTVGNMGAGVYALSKQPVVIGSQTYSVTTLVHIKTDRTAVVYYDGSTLPPDSVMPQYGAVTPVRCGADGVVNLGGTTSGESAMRYSFAQNAFIADNSEVHVDGDLIIASGIDNVVPTVRLKSDASSNGVIRSTGSICIQGSLTGGGALVADGDIALCCNSQTRSGSGADVDATLNSGVVLYGQTVNIFAASNHSVDFRGLIYAEKDVNVAGGLKIVTRDDRATLEYTTDTLDNLHLQGAVVARTGSVNIAETKDVTLKYDPKYLNALTKGMPDNRRRVARVWTRKY